MDGQTVKLTHVFLTIFLIIMFPSTSIYAQHSDQAYSFHVGQWVRYGPMTLDVKADNNYLKLLTKALLSRSMQIPVSTNNNVSMLDIDWLLINVSKVEGNNVTFSMSAKSKFSKDVISRVLSPMNMTKWYKLKLVHYLFEKITKYRGHLLH